jgi:magnesium transporter
MLHAGAHSPLPHDELRLLFRDIDDHLHFVADRIDSYDRLLSDVLSANLAKISVQQNADMRRISSWVAIVAVPTMVAGIYGMNFDYMPELRWRYGYFLVLGVMVSACVGLFVTFKRVKWL